MSVKLERSRDSFMIKVTTKNEGTQAGYKVALNNFENFCMEKFGKADMISDLKEFDTEQIYDFLQAWINWNKKLAPRTIVNLFSRVKKYLHHRGIKLDPQDIKEELDFPTIVEEEMYPMSSDDVKRIFKEMQYKQKTQFLCQLSSLMRIGEVIQLRKKHLITDKPNIIVKIPPTIAKLGKARTTFFSVEASKMLKPLLKKIDDNGLVFGSNENKNYAEVNSEQILRRILVKIGFTERYETNNRFKINTHSFRAYGITRLSRLDVNFAKKIAGQKGYLLQYDRISDEDKLELYRKFESELTVDDSEKRQSELETVLQEKSELKTANEALQKYKIKMDNLEKKVGTLEGLVGQGNFSKIHFENNEENKKLLLESLEKEHQIVKLNDNRFIIGKKMPTEFRFQ